MAEWQNGGRNGRMADRMAEQRISYGGRNGQMVGMVKWQEWWTGMVEWQTEMATYVLFTVHTDTDDDTLIFYSIDFQSLAALVLGYESINVSMYR